MNKSKIPPKETLLECEPRCVRTVSYHSPDTAPDVVGHNQRTGAFVDLQSLIKHNSVVDHTYKQHQSLKKELLIRQKALAFSAL